MIGCCRVVAVPTRGRERAHSCSEVWWRESPEDLLLHFKVYRVVTRSEITLCIRIKPYDLYNIDRRGTALIIYIVLVRDLFFF